VQQLLQALLVVLELLLLRAHASCVHLAAKVRASGS
jgi:hypothetical protein